MANSISGFLADIQFQLGAEVDETGRAIIDTSWSTQLQASENLWMALEGAHVITIMLFVGSILLVDLRLLGVVWRKAPVSAVADSVLPYTRAGFLIMVVTGLALFFANPLEYYHSFMFRLKVIALVAAAINIFIFHRRLEVDRARWDNLAKPPLPARLSAGISLLLWVLVVTAGRFMAYDWVACEGASGFIAEFAQCETYGRVLSAAEAELAI